MRIENSVTSYPSIIIDHQQPLKERTTDSFITTLKNLNSESCLELLYWSIDKTNTLSHSDLEKITQQYHDIEIDPVLIAENFEELSLEQDIKFQFLQLVARHYKKADNLDKNFKRLIKNLTIIQQFDLLKCISTALGVVNSHNIKMLVVPIQMCQDVNTRLTYMTRLAEVEGFGEEILLDNFKFFKLDEISFIPRFEFLKFIAHLSPFTRKWLTDNYETLPLKEASSEDHQQFSKILNISVELVSLKFS